MNFREIITTSVLADYLTAEYGYDLVVWQDGTTDFVPYNFRFRHDEQPICRVKCPGIGNLDSTVFSEGYAKRDHGIYYDYDGYRIGTLADLIEDCCENGDMTAFIDDLVENCEADTSR